MQGYCNVYSKDHFEADIDKHNVYMGCHQDAKFEHFDISNMIYNKFLHSAVSYTLNGETLTSC